MEPALTRWLLDNRPYTHHNARIKQFILFCRSLQPGLSYTALQREVNAVVDKLMQGEVGRLWRRDRCYERVLRMYGANDQRTDGWHAMRGEMITASEVYGVFGTESQRREVMMRKLVPRAPGENSNTIPALAWGTRFEPVAKRIYEARTNCKITDVSCCQHPIFKFLGASPDGLIVPNDPEDWSRYGRLVEFKCPISRVEKAEIPPGYVHQMQMQMECTGIDECEYVEFRFKQVNYSEWFKSTDEKGIFTVYDSGKVVYDEEIREDDTQVIYWILSSTKQDLVTRDRTWLGTYLPGLRAFWDEVLEHRKNGTFPDRPEEKKGAVLDI